MPTAYDLFVSWSDQEKKTLLPIFILDIVISYGGKFFWKAKSYETHYRNRVFCIFSIKAFAFIPK